MTYGEFVIAVAAISGAFLGMAALWFWEAWVNYRKRKALIRLYRAHMWKEYTQW